MSNGRWTVSQHGPDGSDVGIAFDEESERGTVWVQPAGGGVIVSVAVAPRELAVIIRAMERWPLDVMDAMAAADQRKRMGQAVSGELSGEAIGARAVAMWIATHCGHVEYVDHAGRAQPGIGAREACVYCKIDACEAVLHALDLSSLRVSVRHALRRPPPEIKLRVRRGEDQRLEYSDDGLRWCHADQYARNAGLEPELCRGCRAPLGTCVPPCRCACGAQSGVPTGDVFLAMIEHELHWPAAHDVACSCDAKAHKR